MPRKSSGKASHKDCFHPRGPGACTEGQHPVLRSPQHGIFQRMPTNRKGTLFFQRSGEEVDGEPARPSGHLFCLSVCLPLAHSHPHGQGRRRVLP